MVNDRSYRGGGSEAMLEDDAASFPLFLIARKRRGGKFFPSGNSSIFGLDFEVVIGSHISVPSKTPM